VRPAAASGHVTPPTVIERLFAPFHRFTNSASASGLVLIAAAVVALSWANSPWSASYFEFWKMPLVVEIGDWHGTGTLHQLIDDGLMAVFFFLVGLEIKREILAGELKSLRRAGLPMLAALGGMLAPAALYALINRGGEGLAGWGIPMATDIAFALGVLALIGDRVPNGLKVFLAALAIVDDIGAVLVIAVFYSTGVNVAALAAAAAILVVAAVANVAGVRRPWAYGVLGIALWACVLASGVHATVAGVLLAMVIPVRTRLDEAAFLSEARAALTEFDAAAVVTATDPDTTTLSNSEHHTSVEHLESLCEQVQPPLIRLEHALWGPVNFGIMPLFALANAGVSFSGSAMQDVASHPVTLGALLGLVLGKPIGIIGFSWLAVRLGIAALPDGVRWPMLAGAGILGGIGFTMALFIAGLGFANPMLLNAAKAGVLAASLISGVAGWLVLRGATKRVPLAPERA
jgi:NhaA family Na+:H+ antiporter